jgi:hypothetical protein
LFSGLHFFLRWAVLHFALTAHTDLALIEVNVGNADRYHKQADEARWMAAHALKPENKTVWLRIAEAWSILAHQADENDPRRELQREEDSN